MTRGSGGLRTRIADWRDRAVLFRDHAAESVARVYELCAEELEEDLRAQEDTLLNLREAAELSGFSSDHLGRQVRQGKIPNAGYLGAPKIRRRDLPLKSGATLLPGPDSPHLQDATAIVQSVIDEGG